MYDVITNVLFWCYWAIAAAAGVLVLRELFRGGDWRIQATAALTLIPIVLRVFLIK